MSNKIIAPPPDRAISLDNVTCVYCGRNLTHQERSKEHVIGRRFVPKGTLANEWNLLVWACVPCNRKKADLEDDISAITMYHEVWKEGDKADRTLRREAARKMQKSLSRKTKKSVAQSFETLRGQAPFLGGQLRYSFTAPPQIESSRLYELARLHMTGFFYWITYSKETNKGGYWLGGFYPLLEAARMDWGNDVHVGFMKAVVDWDIRVLAAGADGYFKIAIRKHPTDTLWSWAIEWNKSFRVVGFFGEEDAARKMVSTLPPLTIQSAIDNTNQQVRFRYEKTLSETEDILFHWEHPTERP